MKVLPYGEGGVWIELDPGDSGTRPYAVARRLEQAFSERDIGAPDRLRRPAPQAALDVVVGTGGVAVFGGADRGAVEQALSGTGAVAAPRPGAKHEVSVIYDGPDLAEVADQRGLTPSRLIDLHEATEVTVEIVGFLPGFAYMAPVHPDLVVPRRPAPRPRIRAGSVAIAGRFTGIYPFSSPGGWNLIGRLAPREAPCFDPSRAPPARFFPGDRVTFRRADPEDAAPGPPEGHDRAPLPEGPWLRVRRAPACATVQDLGRIGRLGVGLPPSGPLDPRLHAAANARVGNPAAAATIEVPLGTLEIEVGAGPIVVSIDGEPPQALARGDRWAVPSSARAVRYMAVAGGVNVPLVMGSRATLLVAGIGGLGGRPLRRGDVIPVGSVEDLAGSGASLVTNLPCDPEDAALVIDPGPHRDRFPERAWSRLIEGAWRVSASSDRTGVRLTGDAIPREGADLGGPTPMRRGAIQATTDGTPVVLGPDHPTTGGYPVLAVVRAASLPLLAAKKPGDSVRFCCA